jgi:hypothetical protein
MNVNASIMELYPTLNKLLESAAGLWNTKTGEGTPSAEGERLIRGTTRSELRLPQIVTDIARSAGTCR